MDTQLYCDNRIVKCPGSNPYEHELCSSVSQVYWANAEQTAAAAVEVKSLVSVRRSSAHMFYVSHHGSVILLDFYSQDGTQGLSNADAPIVP